MTLDYGSIGPGYKNPLGDDAPSIKESVDWGSFSKDTDWNQTPGIDRTGLFESLFDKAKSRDKYLSEVKDRAREEEKRANSWGGQFSSGGSQRVTENASIYTPPQMSPFTVQGVQGQPGLLSQVAGIAAPVVGMMGGPTAPFISAGLSGISRTGW